MDEKDVISKERTRGYILGALGISEKNVEFVRKILMLKKESNVKDIRLNATRGVNNILSIEVLLNEDFRSLAHFQSYLQNYEIPTKNSRQSRSCYNLREDRVLATFRKIDREYG